MKAFIATNLVGVFAFDAEGRLLAKRLFKKDVEEIAKKILQNKKNEILDEEREVIKDLIKAGYKEVVWDKKNNIEGISCVYKKENIAVEKLQLDFRELALDFKWVSSQAELNEIMTKVNVILTKEKIKKVGRDKIIMQVISVIDEIDKELNVFSEHLREWYGLYFPEAIKIVKSNEKLFEVIEKYGKKEEIEDKELKEHAQKSAGMPFSNEDLKSIQSFSKNILYFFEMKKELSKYLEKTCKEVMPNLSAIAGPLLAARLLASAGGLEKMAKMPSSTVQLLGAEKSLFRHLRGEGKAPKFGILFAHPLIQKAPKDKKGKVARLLAAKLSLAARFDFFAGKDKSNELKNDLNEQMKKVI